MKKASLLIGAIVALFSGLVLFGQQQPKSGTSPSQLGTWQLVSGKYGGTAASPGKDERHVKIITATHFVWVAYDDKERVVTSSMGGSCSLQGNKYTETVEFFVPESMRAYLGKKQEFTIRVEGDKLYQSGKLSDGMEIEEVWQRVKRAQE
jgi:hypothetical protein